VRTRHQRLPDARMILAIGSPRMPDEILSSRVVSSASDRSELSGNTMSADHEISVSTISPFMRAYGMLATMVDDPLA
jgi:hypothetical protein